MLKKDIEGSSTLECFMTNFPETDEHVTNIPLYWSRVHLSWKFEVYIPTKLVADQYKFQQDHFGGLYIYMHGRNIFFIITPNHSKNNLGFNVNF